MSQTVTLERKVLTESLHTILMVHDLFTRYRFEWIARNVDLTVGRWCESSTPLTPPNRHRSPMSKFEAAGWTFLLLPSAASNTVNPLMLRGFPSPESLNIYGTWSRVENFNGVENLKSPPRGGLHNGSPLMVTKQTGCWNP